MSSFLKRSVEINKNAGSLWNMFTLLLQNQEVVAKFTSTIFENKTLIGDLNKTGYDLFLTDPTFPGGVLLAHHLQLPLVFNVRWLFSGEAHLAVAPSSVSYIPICFSHNSDKIDFFQRIRNMIHYIMVFYRDYYVSRQPYQALCDRYFGNNVSLNNVCPMSSISAASKVSLQRPSKFVVFTSIYLLYLVLCISKNLFSVNICEWETHMSNQCFVEF